MNTTYFLNVLSGNLFHSKTTPPLPAQYYIGLSSSTPNISGNNVTEPASSAGYARVLLSNLTEPTDGAVSNSLPVSFEESTANWGLMTNFVIYDELAEGTGNLLMYGELTTPRTVEASTIMTIKANNLNLSIQNPA